MASNSEKGCGAAFSALSSTSQGETFAEMTKSYHGGRYTRKMRGGGMPAEYTAAFETLPTDLRQGAGIASLDSAFNQLPEFAGKYGSMTGGSRRSGCALMRGGRGCGLMRGGVAEVDASPMILTSGEEEAAAHMNPQWSNENLVVPSYKGPENAYAHVQKAGSRKAKKASRKMKGGKKSKKATRKAKKASRKMKGGKKSKKATRKMKGGKKSKSARKH